MYPRFSWVLEVSVVFPEIHGGYVGIVSLGPSVNIIYGKEGLLLVRGM